MKINIKTLAFIAFMSTTPLFLIGQWVKQVALINLHDTTFLAGGEPFEISTYGDSGVAIFGEAIYDGLAINYSKAIAADVNPSDGSFLGSSSPRKLFGANSSFSRAIFYWPPYDRVLVSDSDIGATIPIDSVSLRKCSNDSVISTLAGNWNVIEHVSYPTDSSVWIYDQVTSICKKINLNDGSELQSIDLSIALDDSLFSGKIPAYNLRYLIIDNLDLIVHFARVDPNNIDPISGTMFVEQATLSLSTDNLSVSKNKYSKKPSSFRGASTITGSDKIIYIDENSTKNLLDTTIRKSLTLNNYITGTQLNISYRNKYYINILGTEIIMSESIFSQNGFYLMISNTIKTNSLNWTVDGLRLALFDSLGNLIYDIETDNQFLSQYFKQARISKSGEVYFKIHEGRPTDKIIFGKIDSNGNNTLFIKSPLSLETTLDKKTLITITPNPALNYFEVLSHSVLKEIRLYNTFGEEVYFNELLGNRQLINTNQLARGMYIISIKSKSGNISSGRIILR